MTEDPNGAIREALARHLLAAARHRAAVARSLRLSENEMLAVMHLARAGKLTPTALGRLLSLTSGGTTALVQRLERDRHIVRERHPADGRSTLLALSAESRRRLDEALSPLDTAIDERVAGLSEAARAAVLGFLADTAAVVEEHADRASLTAGELGWAAMGDPVPSLSL